MSGGKSVLHGLMESEQLKTACLKLGVPTLVPHLPAVLLSAASFFLVERASSHLSARLFPKHYKSLSKRTKLEWDMKVVGWVHALISTPLSVYLIMHPSSPVRRDPIFAYGPKEGSVFAISAGYFLYDFWVSLRYVNTNGWPFVLHATACCFIFFKAYTPFLMGYGSSFLVWEASTIFLHPYWFMDKINMTGSTAQLATGVLLMASFFAARICWGGYSTVQLWKQLADPRITDVQRWSFRLANMALMGLNINWFRMMIASVQKRLSVNKKGQAGQGPNQDGVQKKRQ